MGPITYGLSSKCIVCILWINFQSETRSSTLKVTKRKMTPKQVSSDADVNDSPTSEEFHSDSSQSVTKAPVATHSG